MKIKIEKIIIYFILIVGVIVVMYPFFFMVMNSFKTGVEILNNPTSLPKVLTLSGYNHLFKTLNMCRLLFNSAFISISVTVLSVLFSAMTAYALVKTEVPFKNTLTSIILASMMIPIILLLIPTYCMVYQWGWINTYRVLIFPFCISPYNIFLMIQFMKQVDNSYIEAAKIDGANEFTVFCKVILPMVKPALATIAILTFMWSWNDFLNPLLYLRGTSHMTVQLAVYKFSTSLPGQNLEQLWAALTVTTVPIVVVYFLLQKNFMKAFGGVGLK